MDPSNSPFTGMATGAGKVPAFRRHPQRISITISWSTHQRLMDGSDLEGRSLSNLAAHLLETGLVLSS